MELFVKMNLSFGLFGIIFSIILGNPLSMAAPSSQLFPPETVALIRKTFFMLGSDLELVGYGILTAIFKQYPSYLQKFEKFKHIPLNELKDSNGFMEHAGRVANGLKTMVDLIDQPDKLLPVLQKLGRKHVTLGVYENEFKHAKPLILEHIFEVLGEEATPEVRKAWTAVLSAAIKVMIQAQNE